MMASLRENTSHPLQEALGKLSSKDKWFFDVGLMALKPLLLVHQDVSFTYWYGHN